jgi:hypothetical protein
MDWCLEVEDRGPGPNGAFVAEVRPVPPERAYQLAVEYDKTRPQKVVWE